MPFVEMLAVSDSKSLPSLGVQRGHSVFCVKKVAECGTPQQITGDIIEHVATGSGVIYGIWISATLIGTVSVAVDTVIGSAQCTIPIGTGIGFYPLPLNYASALRVKLSNAGDDIAVIYDGSALS